VYISAEGLKPGIYYVTSLEGDRSNEIQKLIIGR
jgi:hypothetical protein